MKNYQEKLQLTTIESINTQNLTEEDIHEIHEIEQDVWGRFLWEYRVCWSCGEIYSKEEVFWSYKLSKYGLDVKKNTIWEIEKILDFEGFNCISCEEKTSPIFWEEFKEEIISRHDFEKSFLLLQRDINWKLLGYIDAYVSDFETVYSRELKHYYSKLWKEAIRKNIENILWTDVPEKIICLSGVGSRPDFATIKNLYCLEKSMVQEISEYNPYLTWIYESIIGSCAHAILDICNAKRLEISQWIHVSCNKNYHSDIFVHENMALEWLKGLWKSFKDFLKGNKQRIRDLRN